MGSWGFIVETRFTAKECEKKNSSIKEFCDLVLKEKKMLTGRIFWWKFDEGEHSVVKVDQGFCLFVLVVLCRGSESNFR